MEARSTRTISLLALTLLVALGLATGRAAASPVPPPSPGVMPVEGEQFSGNWTEVQDPQATNGTAVVINSGAISTQTTTAPGSYTLNVRLKSGAARVALTLDGQQVDTTVVYGSAWKTVSVPVRVNDTPTWAIQQLPAVGYTPQPVYVDWLSLDSASPGLTTAGNKIIDGDGHQTTPHGVNRDGFQWNPTGGPGISDYDFEAMHQWGVTMVRVPLNEQYWNSTSCSYDPTYAQRIDAVVDSITKRGMIALVNLHYAANGQSCAQGYLSQMADDNSIPFWNQVANRYKSNPLVAFDIFNEPHDITEAVWHDGGMVGSWHAVGMQQLYDTVRGTGATNLIFVSGVGWAYRIDVALRRPIDGYGIVYGTHVYNPPENGPLPSDINSVIPPVAARYPVVMTEFGSSSATPAYNQNVIAYAAEYDIGWTAWKWYPLPNEYALLQDWTYTPSPAGQPVYDALQQAKANSSTAPSSPSPAVQ